MKAIKARQQGLASVDCSLESGEAQCHGSKRMSLVAKIYVEHFYFEPSIKH